MKRWDLVREEKKKGELARKQADLLKSFNVVKLTNGIVHRVL